jgi:hypothetical protein
MLNARLLFALLLMFASCQRSSNEAKVIGTWQCNPLNGKVWRMTFASDHTVILALPRDESVDASMRTARFDEAFSGAWRLDGNEVVYTVEDKETHIPKTTTRMKVSDFEHAKPFGVDPNAYLERLK